MALREELTTTVSTLFTDDEILTLCELLAVAPPPPAESRRLQSGVRKFSVTNRLCDQQWSDDGADFLKTVTRFRVSNVCLLPLYLLRPIKPTIILQTL